MDDQRIGRMLRALRRRLGWRQIDLGREVGCSQTLISKIERGRVRSLSIDTLRKVANALDASVVIEVRWRGAALDRLFDDAHATLVNAVAEYLQHRGWIVELEVTYSEFGERGSFDLLAFHPGTATLLAIEVKTDLPSAEATFRKLDEKTRLAPTVASKRFGWRPQTLARLLVFPDHATIRRRVAGQAALFARALPKRNIEIRRWLQAPDGQLSGLWFFSDSPGQSRIRATRPPERVRRPKSGNTSTPSAA